MKLGLLRTSMSFAMASSLGFVYGEAVAAENVGSFQVSDYAVQPITVEMSTPGPKAVASAPEALNEGAAAVSSRWDKGDPLQKTVSEFLEKSKGKKLGMVIGRGNVQGIAEERITIDSLRGLQWLFVDPGDTWVNGFAQGNEQEESQGNALKTTWPLSFSMDGVFDAVVFDSGTLQYIGDDGEYNRLGSERFDKQMELRITQPNGTVISKGSFDAPYKFQDWLIQNKPKEQRDLDAYYLPRMDVAKQRKIEALLKGLKDASSSLKAGGTLIIPIDGTLQGIDVPGVLGVAEDSLKTVVVENLRDLRESPVLPENGKGMGTGWGDYYVVVKPQ